jgi:ribosomal protein L7/L12
MASKEFVVTVNASDYDEPWALDKSYVKDALVSAMGFHGSIYVDEVTEFHRADYALVRTGKIQAIKKIREIISCTLLEAKMIVDTAGSRLVPVSAFGVTVDYDPLSEPNGYHVRKT